MAIYTLELDESTLDGFFSPDLAPVLTIESGDTVRMRTLDAEWALEPFTTFTPGGPPPGPRATTKVEGPKGHALCDPIALRGALPGMTLAIQIDSIRPGSWGWSWGGGELVDGEVMHFWALDAERRYARNQHGHRVGLRPFLGVMGMPPAEGGQHSDGQSGLRCACRAAAWGNPTVATLGVSRQANGSNRREDQEIAMLALHLLQISLVYVNTLMIQDVLRDPVWLARLTAEDERALTPLIYSHVNPYGTF